MTTIDVKQTPKQNLDREFRKYVILGACNPPLADRALHAELEIRLLLPCNVIVYETEPGRSAVAAMAPIAALGIVGENIELQGDEEEREHLPADFSFDLREFAMRLDKVTAGLSNACVYLDMRLDYTYQMIADSDPR